MNRILAGVCGIGAFVSQSALATVTVVNNDSVDYEFEVQCKNDAEPVNEWIDPRGIVDLEGGPCNFTFKDGQKLIVPDNETIGITKGKAALQ
jgi:hypothetical protein